RPENRAEDHTTARDYRRTADFLEQRFAAVAIAKLQTDVGATRAADGRCRLWDSGADTGTYSADAAGNCRVAGGCTLWAFAFSAYRKRIARFRDRVLRTLTRLCAIYD